MKYRKKPVVIDAYQTDKEIVIHTLEGDMKASVGDYIITGVNGEQYPCKPDIFYKTYEPVRNTNYDKIKTMSVEEMAEAIYNGISSDPCDYCPHSSYYCTGVDCKNKSHKDIIIEFLNSEVQEE